MLSSLNACSRNLNLDTLKVIVQTKFGELTFTKICKRDKFEFFQSGKPILDKDVETEAWDKDIDKDTMKVAFVINKTGQIERYNIIKKSRLDKLNIFISLLFDDAIVGLKNEKYSLNCNNKVARHIIPVMYVRQKTK